MVTDEDRAKAAEVWDEIGDNVPYWRGEQAIAVALAEEREKARAPFLALADEYDRQPWVDIKLGEVLDVLGGETSPRTDASHRYDPETCRCICGALDHPDWGVSS